MKTVGIILLGIISWAFLLLLYCLLVPAGGVVGFFAGVVNTHRRLVQQAKGITQLQRAEHAVARAVRQAAEVERRQRCGTRLH